MGTNNQPNLTVVTDLHKKHRDWIEATCSTIIGKMKFGILKVMYEYTDTNETDSHFPNGVANKLLCINVLTPYKTAYIDVSPMAIDMAKTEHGRQQLIHALVHELCHVHTAPLADAAQSRFLTENELETRVEEVTESLADYVRENLQIKYPTLFKEKTN